MEILIFQLSRQLSYHYSSTPIFCLEAKTSSPSHIKDSQQFFSKVLTPSPIVFIYHFSPQFVFIIVKIANQSNRVSRAAKFSHPRSVCGIPCKGPKPVSLPFHMVQFSISACKFDSKTTVQIKLQSTFYFLL